MGRNKKDATQDVLNLYNQMQEDENIESGKDEIKVTLEEIELLLSGKTQKSQITLSEAQ